MEGADYHDERKYKNARNFLIILVGIYLAFLTASTIVTSVRCKAIEEKIELMGFGKYRAEIKKCQLKYTQMEDDFVSEWLKKDPEASEQAIRYYFQEEQEAFRSMVLR